jgi:hypothetical protein
LAFDVNQAVQLLMLIPKCNYSMQKLKEAADLILRLEGGDLSLVDRILANRQFQEYLAQNDPDHPLRAVGEYAEQRQKEETGNEAGRRETLEIEILHKKRMLELDCEERMIEIAAKKARLELETAQLTADAAAADLRRSSEREQQLSNTHENFRRERALTIGANFEALKALKGQDAPLSPRSLRVVEDELRTGLLGQERPDAALGRPIYLSKFLADRLLLREAPARARAQVLGRHVLEAMRDMFPEYDTAATTNRVINGYDRDVRMYFEAHLPAIERALERYMAVMPPLRDEELTTAGLQRRRAAARPDVQSFFVPRASAAAAAAAAAAA